MKEEDREQLVPLIQAYFREAVLYLEPNEANASTLFSEVCLISVVAEQNGTLVGFDLVAPIFFHTAVNTVNLVGSYVTPEQRKRGLNKVMRHAMFARAKLFQVQKIISVAYTDVNLAIVEKMGFKKAGWLVEKEIV